MINTIFYFADTLAEYSDMFSKGLVKPHTICFAKDTKTIWRNGMRFSGLRQDEVDDEIHNLTDEAIQNLEFGLDTAVRAAAEEKIRLNGEISRIDGDVADVASNLTATAAAIRNEVRNGELYTSEGWDPKINAYLKTVGLWDYGAGDTQHVTKWSTLRQSVSDVSSEVNRVEAKADGYNNTLQSKINQEVTDRGEAVTTLNNTFAKSTKDLQDVIEWMYSGLHSGASADMSYAEIIAAGKNGASSAISDLRTSIETTSDGKYVAKSSLTSSVDSAISGIVNDVTGKYANTSVFSQIDTNKDNIAAINTFIGPDVAQSTLAAKLNGAEAGAVATVKNDLASMNILSKSSSGYEAGVYTKGEMADAVASLIANDERNAASVIAQVNKEGSSLSLNADRINLGGQTWAEFITALNITALKVNVVDENESTVSLLLPNGTVKFMSGQIYVPHVTRTMSGEISGETGFVICSKDGFLRTFYLHGGLGVLSSRGVISSSIWGSEADDNGSSSLTFCNYGSTKYTSNYSDRIAVVMNRGFLSSRASGVGYFAISNLANDTSSYTGEAEIDGWDVIKFGTNNLKSNVSLVVSSDERLKTIVSNVNPKVEDIAKARTVNFYYNDDSSKRIRTGSIAQDWQKIIPNVVQEDKDGTLNLDYASAALVSVVSIAKELTELKKENEELKQRLASIETKLTTI